MLRLLLETLLLISLAEGLVASLGEAPPVLSPGFYPSFEDYLILFNKHYPEFELETR